MASISVPALHVPEQPDLGSAIGRMMQLKSMMQGQQLQAQEVQRGQMDLDSRKALMKAYKEASGDLDKALPLAASYGAQPGDLIKLKQAAIEQQSANLKLLTEKGARAFQEADMMQGAHDVVAAAPPEQRPALYQQQMQGLAKAGVDVSKAPPQYPGDEAFANMGVGLKGHTQQLEDLAKKTGITKAVAETNRATAETNKLNLETNPDNPADPHIREQKYQNILQALQNGKQVSAQDASWARSYEASNRKTTTSSDSLGVTSSNTSGPSGLSAVKGGGGGTGAGAGAQGLKDSMVDMVGQYKLNPTMLQRMMVKHPEVIAAVQQKYPDWDQTSYNAKNKILLDYTSGAESKTINAINTALGHAGELNEAIKALNNGDIGLKTLRSIGNRLGVEVGGDAVTTFNTIVHRLAPEISAAYVQGGGTGGERAVDAKDFDASLGNSQLTSNLATTVKLLRSKISAQENQWNNTFHPTKDADKFENRFITPQAKSTLDSLSAKAPGGGGGGHVIKIGDKRYQYKGSGNTADLANYAEVK